MVKSDPRLSLRGIARDVHVGLAAFGRAPFGSAGERGLKGRAAVAQRRLSPDPCRWSRLPHLSLRFRLGVRLVLFVSEPSRALPTARSVKHVVPNHLVPGGYRGRPLTRGTPALLGRATGRQGKGLVEEGLVMHETAVVALCLSDWCVCYPLVGSGIDEVD